MSNLEQILLDTAGACQSEFPKDAIWVGLMARLEAAARRKHYALLAAASAAMFALGLWAGIVSQRPHFDPALEIPKTDGPVQELKYEQDVTLFAPLPGDTIDALLPGWLPAGLPDAAADTENSWHAQAEEDIWVHAEVVEFDQLESAFTAGLRIGVLRSCAVYEETDAGENKIVELIWITRLTEHKYLSVTAAGISYEDGIKIIEQLGGSKNEIPK